MSASARADGSAFVRAGLRRRRRPPAPTPPSAPPTARSGAPSRARTRGGPEHPAWGRGRSRPPESEFAFAPFGHSPRVLHDRRLLAPTIGPKRFRVGVPLATFCALGRCRRLRTGAGEPPLLAPRVQLVGRSPAAHGGGSADRAARSGHSSARPAEPSPRNRGPARNGRARACSAASPAGRAAPRHAPFRLCAGRRRAGCQRGRHPRPALPHGVPPTPTRGQRGPRGAPPAAYHLRLPRRPGHARSAPTASELPQAG